MILETILEKTRLHFEPFCPPDSIKIEPRKCLLKIPIPVEEQKNLHKRFQDSSSKHFDGQLGTFFLSVKVMWTFFSEFGSNDI